MKMKLNVKEKKRKERSKGKRDRADKLMNGNVRLRGDSILPFGDLLVRLRPFSKLAKMVFPWP